MHSLPQRTAVAIVVGNYDYDRHIVAHRCFQLHYTQTERKVAADRNDRSFRICELGRNRVRNADTHAAAGPWSEPAHGNLYGDHPLASRHGEVAVEDADRIAWQCVTYFPCQAKRGDRGPVVTRLRFTLGLHFLPQLAHGADPRVIAAGLRLGSLRLPAFAH